MAKYWEELGLTSPIELALLAETLLESDPGLGVIISQLGVIRDISSTFEEEEKILVEFQEILKKRSPELREIAKQNRAKYN